MWSETNLLAQQLDKIREQEKTEALDRRAESIFAEFDFYPAAFREAANDFYYQELQEREVQDLQEKRDLEFKELYDKYSNPEIYSGPIPSLPLFRSGQNCMTFALDLLKNPVTGEIFEANPGPGEIAYGEGSFEYKVGDKLLVYGKPEAYKEYAVMMLKKDAACAGLELEEVFSPDYETKDGEWLIALATQDNKWFEDADYHFYRRGDYGTWYHKEGKHNPSRVDDSGKQIFDPKTCDRGTYSIFHGYFVVRPTKTANG